jgi:hypothetical protein
VSQRLGIGRAADKYGRGRKVIAACGQRSPYVSGFFARPIEENMATATAKTLHDHFDAAAECIRRHPSLSRTRLYRAALVGQVRTQLLPGLTPRYSRADVDRWMASQGAKGGDL